MTPLLIFLAVAVAALAYLILLARADAVTGEFHLTGNASYTKDLPNRQAFETFQIGSNNFPALDQTYTTGTGTDQANKYAVTKYTIAGGANQDVDLSGVLVDDLGTTVAFTVIKELLIAIDSPDGVKTVRVGPQAVANAWQGPFGGVAAANYETVYKAQRWSNPYVGWAVVNAASDILRLNNPGGGAIDVHVAILGA